MSALLNPAQTKSEKEAQPYRVVVVDDSAVIRGVITRWLEEDSAIQVVSSASNGKIAIAVAERVKPEIIILDIEMPEMDGLTALPQLLKAVPGVQVIMASTLTRRNADVSLRALSMGAADYIPKPETRSAAATSVDFRREIVEKVKALGGAARRGRPAFSARPASALKRAPEPVAAPRPEAEITLRPLTKLTKPRALAVGSSTGGPQALFEVFKNLSPALNVPVFLTQHMPVTFTAILAEHIHRISGLPCAEGQDGEIAKPGHIYVAPGDRHMIVEEKAVAPVIRITDGPQENFCRPAVDPMLRSLAKVYGGSLLTVILTGMGQDGLSGARDVIASGGTLVAQDRPSSVVWGMPGAVAKAGLCHAVLPLTDIAPRLKKFLQGDFR